MGGPELTVLVVDDDFRVANMHAGIVAALPGFTVTGRLFRWAYCPQVMPKKAPTGASTEGVFSSSQ